MRGWGEQGVSPEELRSMLEANDHSGAVETQGELLSTDVLNFLLDRSFTGSFHEQSHGVAQYVPS